MLYINGVEVPASTDINVTVPSIDPTLTHAGQAADAKAVGDRFGQLSGKIDDLYVFKGYSHDTLNSMDLSKVIRNYGYMSSEVVVGSILAPHTASGYCVGYADVLPGRTYALYRLNSTKIQFNPFFAGIFIVCLDADGRVLSKYSLSQAAFTINDAEAVSISFTYNQYMDEYQWMVLEYEDGTQIDNPTEYIKYSPYVPTYAPAGYQELEEEINQLKTKSVLDGKTILFTGDSICYGAGWSGYNRTKSLAQHDDMENIIGNSNNHYYNLGWAQIIAENNPKATVYGYGIGGTYIARRQSQIDADGYDSSILERITVMKDTADYVIFHGGINDQGGKIPLGSVRNNGNSLDQSTSNYDSFTFAGAVEQIIIDAKTKYPNAKIGFILTPKVAGREHANYIVDGVNYKQESYMNIIKEACAKWGVPVCDLYSQVSSYFNGKDSTYWLNGDELHPTELTYRTWVAPIVESWLKSI